MDERKDERMKATALYIISRAQREMNNRDDKGRERSVHINLERVTSIQLLDIIVGRVNVTSLDDTFSRLLSHVNTLS